MLLYVATKPWTDDFRSFLVGHLRLLAVVPTWTVRVMFPLALQRTVADYGRAAHEELEGRLDSQTLNDLQWYFFHCRRQTDWSTYPGDALKVRFRQLAQAFAGPRFTHLYRRWLTEGNVALTVLPAAISEASTSGRAGLDLRLSPHTYEQFSPLVSRRGSRRPRVTADATKGDESRRSLNPALNPVP